MTARSSKIAVSLDAQLLARAERLRDVTGESRSALVARALENLTRAAAHELDVARYVAAYRAQPEDAAQLRTARELARRAARRLPWEE